MTEIPESIGPYKILSKLGEGGMGVVYKGLDQRLDRVVALKVISNSRPDPTRHQRFWQEARAAAQVAHPNACRLYDVAEEQNHLVLVMEFVEGESLALRISRGALPAHEASQIVLGILSALGAFHKAGIVHRDVKPGNILLSPSGTKLMDFGIAKLSSVHTPGESDLTLTEVTLPGLFLGTPRYASPEQFRGVPVDARSDLFSTGALFFEMLTGQSPFPGESFGEIAHSVLHARPPALSGSPAISALGRIVSVAMARDPHDRYSTAEAMAADVRAALLLDGIDTAASARPLRRLIVLPFRLLRPSAEIQFLAFSLPEAITASLGGLENLTVRSSIVAARYSDDSPDLLKIATEAEVDVVLTGALLQLGEQLRITAQLVEAPSGTLLWSHSSQGTTHELLELHDDLVRRVVDSILPSLTASEQQSLQQERPASPTIYELYLRANEYSRQWENLPAAIEMYERCVAADPSYAPSWARLGRARWLWDKYQFGSREGLRAADEDFQKALQLSPNLPLAHNLYTPLQVDQGRSLDAMKRLLDRAPQRRGDADIFAGLAHVCRYCGLLQAGLSAYQEARRLDPLIPTSVNHTYFMLGDYQRSLETSGGDFGFAIALDLTMLGRTDDAIGVLRQKEPLTPWRLGKLYLTSLRALLEGDRAQSLKESDQLAAATFRDPEGFYYLARQFAFLGERTKALEQLSRSIKNGFFCYSAMVRDPWLDPLRGHEEFVRLLRQAHELHLDALKTFLAADGATLLRISPENP